MLAFLTNKVPSFKHLAFLTQIKKNDAIFIISTKIKLFVTLYRLICWLELTKLVALQIFRILRHYDVMRYFIENIV